KSANDTRLSLVGWEMCIIVISQTTPSAPLQSPLPPPRQNPEGTTFPQEPQLSNTASFLSPPASKLEALATPQLSEFLNVSSVSRFKPELGVKFKLPHYEVRVNGKVVAPKISLSQIYATYQAKGWPLNSQIFKHGSKKPISIHQLIRSIDQKPQHHSTGTSFAFFKYLRNFIILTLTFSAAFFGFQSLQNSLTDYIEQLLDTKLQRSLTMLAPEDSEQALSTHPILSEFGQEMTTTREQAWGPVSFALTELDSCAERCQIVIQDSQQNQKTLLFLTTEHLQTLAKSTGTIWIIAKPSPSGENLLLQSAWLSKADLLAAQKSP
ncbi:MAG: hypothetical protein OXT67_14125, partial [Zetaproteobacteria bacterium]|nr:hypothetical protein [Zetaproteobacteria bacterium]